MNAARARARAKTRVGLALLSELQPGWERVETLKQPREQEQQPEGGHGGIEGM